MANRSRSPRARAVKLGARHSPLAQVVAGEIRERILAGRFAPGERLAEEPLSEELGVSRMPVREALRLLSAEGIVVVEPRRGASVASYAPQQVQELVEVRATLEGLNARLAARRHDPAQVAKLEKIVADGSRINERTELSVIQANNARFHEALEDIAANSVLSSMVRSLRDRTAILFARQSRARTRENWHEHEGILRAVIAGDAELAGILATRHVYNAAQMPTLAEVAPAAQREPRTKARQRAA
ncbi:MAG TPA: GntR family transcriptional regulator [Usitatibacter sp.]|jgi:DNA-binding GntR family transcriptional regulator|nr:GntR family transcriptional regulator [Usitatibacter sp.]